VRRKILGSFESDLSLRKISLGCNRYGYTKRLYEGACWGAMPEPIPNLIPLVLINGAISAVAVIVPAFLLSRFTRDIIGRSVLVIFLFVAAGAYFGFATLGRDVVDTQPIWMLVELAQVIVFGTLALLGLRGSPYWLAAG
jgi:hypothetical protein